MNLKEKLTRYRLMERHSQLACGSCEDMEIARNILELLNNGKLCLDLSDIAHRTECELCEMGLPVFYSENYYAARFTLSKGQALY